MRLPEQARAISDRRGVAKKWASALGANLLFCLRRPFVFLATLLPLYSFVSFSCNLPGPVRYGAGNSLELPLITARLPLPLDKSIHSEDLRAYVLSGSDRRQQLHAYLRRHEVHGIKEGPWHRLLRRPTGQKLIREARAVAYNHCVEIDAACCLLSPQVASQCSSGRGRARASSR